MAAALADETAAAVLGARPGAAAWGSLEKAAKQVARCVGAHGRALSARVRRVAGR
jgi:hypothetical protein